MGGRFGIETGGQLIGKQGAQGLPHIIRADLGERRLAAEFARVADLAVDRVVTRLQQHAVVLRAARGLLSAARGVALASVPSGSFGLFLIGLELIRFCFSAIR